MATCKQIGREDTLPKTPPWGKNIKVAKNKLQAFQTTFFSFIFTKFFFLNLLELWFRFIPCLFYLYSLDLCLRIVIVPICYELKQNYILQRQSRLCFSVCLLKSSPENSIFDHTSMIINAYLLDASSCFSTLTVQFLFISVTDCRLKYFHKGKLGSICMLVQLARNNSVQD